MASLLAILLIVITAVIWPMYKFVPNTLDEYVRLLEEARENFPSLCRIEKRVWKLEDAEEEANLDQQGGQHENGRASELTEVSDSMAE